MILPSGKDCCFQKKRMNFVDWNEKRRTEKRGGVKDSWLDVRKRGGGVIQMRTVCNRGGGGGV